MARTGIRFRPPNLQGSPEIDWVLRRAFGPPSIRVGAVGELDRQTACDIAQKLSLMARIRTRTPRETLEVEVGSESIELFDRDTVLNTGMELQHEQVCRDLARLARELSIPVIWLKGMALRLMQATLPGSRRTGDIDVLVPSESGTRLYEALIESGCERSGIRAPEHHLSMLQHALGSAIEIHHEIDGVRFDDRAYATAEQCLGGNLVVEADGIPPGTLLPVEPLLVAHLLAHGLSHHGKAPEAYPAFQLLADLQDLGKGQPADPAIDPVSTAWVAGDVSGQEVSAVIDVLRRLSAGEKSSTITCAESDSATLLSHWIAGSLDPDYLQSLKLGRRLDSQRGRGRARQIARTGWRAVWLSDQQVEMLYGQPRSALGYLGWRLWRPFDLIGRTCSSVAAWLRLQKRR
ncbi:MAG: nucleotidyltransferase family protein [Thermoanaerobaculia bacterium]